MIIVDRQGGPSVTQRRAEPHIVSAFYRFPEGRCAVVKHVLVIAVDLANDDRSVFFTVK